MRWQISRKRKTKKHKPSAVYVAHKEQARTLVQERLVYFNEYYQLQWNRIAIRDTKRTWGSCTSLKNLNFNYKIVFLPPHLQDYIIVHELCHLRELHHGQTFWDLVAEQLPHHRELAVELRSVDRQCAGNVRLLTAWARRYHELPTR